ncbi:thymidine phosphorylase [archaeon]|nr:thymidine phosphorylase [archaeon]MBT5288349.1 thymidine phosphorylase [archaeon]MBT7280840.1 thymidine phosphorylase [archaeon]
MKLKVKDFNLSTGGPLVAVLNEKTLKDLNIIATDRIKLKRIKKDLDITCVVNVSDKGIKKNEIGLFDEVLKKLDLKAGTSIEVERADRPASINYIKKKLEGEELNEKEIKTIIKDIMENELSESELTYFVSGTYTNGLSLKESVYLTNAIVNTGEKLNFKNKIIVDKHCVGGVAGNRTTMIVIPIIAALGYKMPKTSSRAITSASGTADTVETIAPVTLSKSKIEKLVKKTNACMVWGGSVNIAAADDKLIKIRHPLSIDPEGMLLASIMAKKKAVGATHVLIDIPYGPSAKLKNKRQAKNLKKSFEKIAKELNIKIKVVLTDGSFPIGNGIGPALEIRDVISVLKGDGPNDLRAKSIFLATEILKLVKEKNPRKKAIKTLESGLAYKKFREIIQEQGGLKRPVIPQAKHFYNVKAKRSGKVKGIDNKKIAKLARLAGAPDDKTAGLYIRVNKNSKIDKRTHLFTIYSNSKKNIATTKRMLKEIDPIDY